jgi:hypothetical protein
VCPGTRPKLTNSAPQFHLCFLPAAWQSQHVLSPVPVGFDAVTSDFLLRADGFFTAFELDHSGARWIVGRQADR